MERYVTSPELKARNLGLLKHDTIGRQSHVLTSLISKLYPALFL